MTTVPQMQMFALRSVVNAITAAGEDPERVLARVGLSLSDLQDVDRRVPTRLGFDLACAASEMTGDAHFGLHWGASEEPSTLGAVGYVMLHSPTIGESLFSLCRYLHLVYEGLDLQVHVDAERAAVRYRTVRDSPIDLRQDNEHALAFIVRLLQLLVGSDWQPDEIRFRHARPKDTSEYERWLDVPMQFETDYNEVVFPRALLERPNAEADATLLPILQRHVADLLESAPAQDDIPGLVRAQILHSLPTGDASLPTIAKRLEMTERTLQRRLGEHDVLFKELVESARHELTSHYLAQSDASLTEIAFMAGYSEVSAFTRAFRRWTGKTPLEFRQRQGA